MVTANLPKTGAAGKKIFLYFTKLKIFIGVLVLVTYLCPFVSCNKESVVLPAAIKHSVVKAGTIISAPAEKATQPENKKRKLWTNLFFPTDNSVSGLGEVLSFDDNETTRFLLVSFLLSIVILLPLKFSHYKIGRIIIVALNLAFYYYFHDLYQINRLRKFSLGHVVIIGLVTFHLLLEIKYKTGNTSAGSR